MESLLAKYERRARYMDDAALLYSLADIDKTLPLYRDTDPTQGYHAKLWAERDAYSVELMWRRKGKRRQKRIVE